MPKNEYSTMDDFQVVKENENEQKNAKKSSEAFEPSANPIFQKNLQALFQQDEILAARLWGMEEMADYDVFVGKDPIDINIINNKTLKYVYENPVKDVQNTLESVENEYKRYPIMYFYGLGNGILYKALLKNETHQKIIVVEPEIEIIYAVLNLIDLSDELSSERLTLFYSEFANYTQFYYLACNSKFTAYAKIYNLQIHSPFYDQFSDDYAEINQSFAKAISQMVAGHGNSIDDNLIGVRNNIENLTAMLTNYSYVDLIKKRYKLMDTAVIVSTGPSLDKQLETLKKFAPYVTVISLDASLPILMKHGIKPDYVTSIERVEATSSFFKKRDKDAYFIIASLTHKKTIKNILPRRLVLTMRPQQNETSFGLKGYGYLGIGHSTANQAYQLAYVLKHKNIVLIGQDLAFAPDGKSHATGHAFAQADEYLYVKAYGGEGEVRTTYVWDKFRNQFEADIDTMQELCKDKKQKNLPNIAPIKEKRANKDMLKAYKVLVKKLSFENEAKRIIEETFLEVVPKIDEISKLRDEGKLSEKHFHKLVKISNRIDKAKDAISKPKFKPFIENIVAISVYFQELELAKISVAPSDTTMQKVNKLIEWIEMHKYWLFSVAGGLNAEIETIKKASRNLVRELKKRGLITKNEIGQAKENFRLSY